MDNKRLADDYNELLLEAIDTIVAARLSELSYDTTIQCTVVDNTEREDGIYKVTDGSTTFTAYSDNTFYTLNSTVMVNIPNGDWSQQKYITGRYLSSKTDDKYIYADPLAQVANLSGSIDIDQQQKIYNDESESAYGLSATSQKEEKKLLLFHCEECDWNTEIYNTVGISADFKAIFNEDLMISGSYGLLLTFNTSSGDVIQFSLNTEDMFGNPYNYNTWFKHTQTYKIKTSVGKITSFTCHFFQDGQFAYWDGEANVPYDSENNNIFTRNISLFLGAEAATVSDNTAKIYTEDLLRYEGQELKDKEITLLWYNKAEGNNFLSFSDGVFNKELAISDKYTSEEAKTNRNEAIYKLFGLDSDDKLSDDQKKQLDEYLQQEQKLAGDEKVPIPEDDETLYYWVEWVVDNEFGDPVNFDHEIQNGQVIQDQYLVQTISCAPEILQTQVYAIVWQNKNKYISNILTFTNQSEVSNVVLNQDITLEIIHGARSQDSYALYNESDMLAISANGSVRRFLNTKINWSRGVVPPDYWKNYSITWRIPKTDSMLVAPTTVVDGVKKTGSEEYVLYTYDFIKTIIGDDNEESYEAVSDMFYYNIQQHYYSKATNNTIDCCLHLKDAEPDFEKDLYDSISFQFSTIGSSGTEYTIMVQPDKEKYDQVYMYNDVSLRGDINVNSFICTLIDPDGKEIDADFSQSTLNLTQDRYFGYDVFTAKTTVKWAERNVLLEHLYPIIFSQDSEYSAEVPSIVSYDENKKIKDSSLTRGKQLSLLKNGVKYEGVVKWTIVYESEDVENVDSTYKPLIKRDKDGVDWLILPEYAFANLKAYITAVVDDSVVWSSPIILQQYLYNSDILNNWTGNTVIPQNEKDKNIIFSSSFVAGEMDKSNKFNGVILGKIESIIDSDSKINTGIYGYCEGQQAYAFKDDGTAFIGKPGAGRIYFDGSNGIIAAGGWFDDRGKPISSGGTGLKIDVKNGTLTSQGFSISEEGKAFFSGEINVNGKFIVDENGNVNIGDKLKYDGNTLTVEGTIEASSICADNITASNKANKSFIWLSDLKADGGSIAGWDIDDKSISKNNFYISSTGLQKPIPGNETLQETFSLYANDTFGITTGGDLYIKTANVTNSLISKQVDQDQVTQYSIGVIAGRGLMINGKYKTVPVFECRDNTIKSGINHILISPVGIYYSRYGQGTYDVISWDTLARIDSITQPTGYTGPLSVRDECLDEAHKWVLEVENGLIKTAKNEHT